MTWLLSIVLSGLGWLRNIATAILRWLLSDIRHIAITLLAAIAIVFWFRMSDLAEDRDEWKAASAKWRTATFAWRDAYQHYHADVLRVTAEAEEADRANAARVNREQQTIIERTKDVYESRLADTRAAVRQLRQQLDAANAARSDGGGGPADLSGADEARCRAFGAADCDAFFTALPDILAAAEDNTAKLIALQAFVNALLALDWDGSARGPEATLEGEDHVTE